MEHLTCKELACNASRDEGLNTDLRIIWSAEWFCTASLAPCAMTIKRRSAEDQAGLGKGSEIDDAVCIMQGLLLQ